MPQEKEYFAFISYQRKDEEWADRLRSKLEHYRLPSSVRKQDASLPKEIRPIFRDTLELAGGVLAKEIETALQQSKYLIVICSPNSAKSPWVNKEIQTFIDLGCEDRIIPFIIDGSPFSDNEENECFPPALRSLKGEKELLGININEMGRDAAAVKVVARMFGLKFDALWQRYEREKKKKRWIVIGGALFFALVSLGIGGYFVKQNKTIQNQKSQLVDAANRLRDDSVTLSNHILKIQNDSLLLSLQKDSILRTNKLLEESNSNLEKAYDGLRRANQEILQSNWSLKISNARILAERAVEKMEDGDAVSGIKYLRQLCTDSDIEKMMCLPEVEKSLRMAYGYQFKKGINGYLVLEDIGKVTLAGFCDNDENIYAVVNDTCVVKYDATTGAFKGVVGVMPYIDSPEYDIYVYAYDDYSKCILFSFGNAVYSYDIINGCNKVDPIIASSFIDYVVVSPSYDYVGYSVEFPDERPYEWHVAKVNDSQHDDYTIPDCEMIYAFSPDGKRCLVEIGSTYYIYDVAKRDTCFQVHSNYIEDAHFCSNGDYIVINTKRDNEEKGYGGIQDMKVYSMLKRDYIPYGENISEEGYHPLVFREGPKDNFYVSGNYDGEIKVYTNISPPDELYRIPGSLLSNNNVYKLHSHNETIKNISFNRRGTSMMSVSERMIRLWNVNFQTSLELIKNFYRYIVPSGKYFIGETDDKNMAVADVEKHIMIGTPLYSIDSKFETGLVSRTGEVVVATKDTFVYVMRPIDNEGFRIQLHEAAIYSRFSISKDGSHFALFTQSRGDIPSSLSIYDTKEQKEIAWVDSLMISNFSINPNGNNIAVAHYDKKTEIRDTETLKVIHSLVGGHTGYVRGLTYSPDGTLIASFGSDNVLCIWDANSGKLKKRFPSVRYQYNTTGGFSFSTDNKYIMITLNQSESFTSKELIYIWNIETGVIVDSYEDINSCWFCQDVPGKMYYKGEFAQYFFRNFPTLEQLVNYIRR